MTTASGADKKPPGAGGQPGSNLDDLSINRPRLTPQGRTAAEGARDMLARVDALWAERLSPRDYATLKRLLARITEVS